MILLNMWNIDNDQTESLSSITSILPDQDRLEVLPSNELAILSDPTLICFPDRTQQLNQVLSSIEQLDGFDDWFESLFNEEFSTSQSVEDEGGMNSLTSSEISLADLNTAVHPP